MPTDNRASSSRSVATAMMLYMSAQNELAKKAKENIDDIKFNTDLDHMCLYIVEDTYDNTPDDAMARETLHYELPPAATKHDFVPVAGISKVVVNPNVFNLFLGQANAHFARFGQDHTRQKILILWGHGGGMVMLDEDKETGTARARASIADFVEVLEQQKELRFDIIAFDSCYMGVIEVMNQFRDATEFALVSSTVVDADGYPYKKFIGDLKQRGPILGPKGAADLIATCYNDHYRLLLPGEDRLLFICDMSEIKKCVDALNKLGDEMSGLLGPDASNDPVRDAINEALIAAHSDSAYVPVLMFLRKLESRLASHAVPGNLDELQDAMTALANAVKAAFTGGKLGDSGYMPTSPLIWSPDNLGIFLRDHEAYNQLDSSSNGTGGWVKMWAKFHGIQGAMNIGTVAPGKFRLGLPKLILFGQM